MAGFDFSPFLEPVANTSAPAAVQAAPVAPVAVVKPEIKVVKKSVEETSTFDFSDYLEAVTDVLTAPAADPAPVSEDPDRQFFQSGVGMEDRAFEPEAEGYVEPVLPKAIVTPQSDDQFVERNLSPVEQTSLSYRGPSWQKAQGLPISTNGQFSQTKLLASLKKSGLNSDEDAIVRGTIRTEVGVEGAIPERPFSIGNLGSGTGDFRTGGAWDTRLKNNGLLDANGNVTQAARDFNSASGLGDAIINSVYGGRNGNGDYASGDGSFFKGRGLIQITGRDNYEAVQDKLAEAGITVDLLANPDLVNDDDYALPAALAMMDVLGINPSTAKGLSAKTLNNAINSGADRATAEGRWANVIAAASPSERAELELRNEYAAQVEVGAGVDGDIGTGTKGLIDTWATGKSLTPPAVTPITKIRQGGARAGQPYQTYSAADKLKLAVFVNENK